MGVFQDGHETAFGSPSRLEDHWGEGGVGLRQEIADEVHGARVQVVAAAAVLAVPFPLEADAQFGPEAEVGVLSADLVKSVCEFALVLVGAGPTGFVITAQRSFKPRLARPVRLLVGFPLDASVPALFVLPSRPRGP